MHNQTETEKYNSMNTIIFYAMFAAQAVLLIIVSYLLKTSGPMSPDLGSSFQIILPLLTIGAVIGSMFLPKIILGSISGLNENEKLKKYRASLLVRWALLDGANGFSIVVYLLTGSVLALGISVLLLILFIFNKPSLDKMKEELSL
jgi:hypothetical protein